MSYRRTVIYLSEDGMISTMRFPTGTMAIHWYYTTEQMKGEMEDIPSHVFNSDSQVCEAAAVPRLVDWLRHYTLVYLHRWGSNMVAADIHRSAENSNLSLPENLRVAIPTDVTGTAVGCCRTGRRRSTVQGVPWTAQSTEERDHHNPSR